LRPCDVLLLCGECESIGWTLGDVMRLAVVLLVAFVAAVLTAEAAPVEELFQQFGLFGTWAPDCRQDASPANPHVRITTLNPGQVIEEHDLGTSYALNHYSMISAERLSDEQLSVEVVFQPGTDAEERQKLIFRVRDGTRRTMFNQPDEGEVRVKHGIVLPQRIKTPTLKKCK